MAEVGNENALDVRCRMCSSMRSWKDHIFFNRIDLFLVLVICSIHISLVALFWGRIGDPFIDSGMEAYYALHISRGGAYLRDFVALVPPLSLQLNGLFMYFWGPQISVLYVAGATSGLVFLLFLYGVLRHILDRMVAFAITFATLVVTVHSVSAFNFTLPYCYAMPYASVFFIVSLFALIQGVKLQSRKCFWLASLLFGVSIACKTEFLAFAFLLLLVGIKGPLLSWKQMPLFAGCLATPTALSMGIAFLRGLSLEIFVNRLVWVKQFASSPMLRAFYKSGGVLGFSDDIDVLAAVLHFLALIGFFLIAICIRIFARSIVLEIVCWLVLASLIFCLPWRPASSFTLIGPTSYVVFLLFMLFAFYNKPVFLDPSCIIGMTFVAAGLKTCLSPLFNGYGSIFLPYYLGLWAIALFCWLSKYLPKDVERVLPVAFALLTTIVTLMSYCNLNLPAYLRRSVQLNQADYLNNQQHNISSGVNSIYLEEPVGSNLKDVLQKIAALRRRNSSLMVLPEGPMLNFFLDMPPVSEYLNLSPIFFQTYGEQAIVEAVRETSPHFIVFDISQRSDYVGGELVGVSHGLGLRQTIDALYCQLPLDNKGPLLLYSSLASDCTS